MTRHSKDFITRRDGYRAQIREAGEICFFRDRNDSGTFEAGGHHSLTERNVKDVCENILQLLSTVFQNTSRDVVWPYSLVWIDASQGLLYSSCGEL